MRGAEWREEGQGELGKQSDGGFPFVFLAEGLNPPLYSSPEKGSWWDAYVLVRSSTLLLTVCAYCCGDPAWACEDKEMTRGATPMAVAFHPSLTVQ